MNAIKISPRKSAKPLHEPLPEVNLKFLSPMQRDKSKRITKEWKFFTYPLFAEMIDKI